MVGVGILLGVVAPGAGADLVGEVVGAPFLEFVGVILGVFSRGDGDLSGFGFGGDISSVYHGCSVSSLFATKGVIILRCPWMVATGMLFVDFWTCGDGMNWHSNLREPACW